MSYYQKRRAYLLAEIRSARWCGDHTALARARARLADLRNVYLGHEPETCPWEN